MNAYFVATRLLNILQRKSFTIKDVMRENECSERTVKRDIEYLRESMLLDIQYDRLKRCYINKGKRKI